MRPTLASAAHRRSARNGLVCSLPYSLGLHDAPWLSEYGSEQTRPFRALRLWAALASVGRTGYRRLIDADLDRAARLARLIDDHPRLDVAAHGLSIVCFRLADDGGDEAEIARRLQVAGESFVTATTVDGRPALRACFVNPLTTDEDVERIVATVIAAADGG